MGPTKQEVLLRPVPFILHNGRELNGIEKKVFIYLLTHDTHITPLPTDQVASEVFRGHSDPKRTLKDALHGIRTKAQPEKGKPIELAVITIDDPDLKRTQGTRTSSLKLYIADPWKEFYEKRRKEIETPPPVNSNGADKRPPSSVAVSKTIFTAHPTAIGTRRSPLENFASAVATQYMERFVSQIDRNLTHPPDLKKVASSVIGYTGLSGQITQELIDFAINQNVVYIKRGNMGNGKTFLLEISRKDALALAAFCYYVAYTLKTTGRLEFFDRSKTFDTDELKNKLTPFKQPTHIIETKNVLTRAGRPELADSLNIPLQTAI